jgi:hypothetical protein
MSSNSVLYYPYIRVPDSAWFTQMLLYWDHVNTITPREFIENPDMLDEHTIALVREGLVNQVSPGAYAGQIPNFSRSFIRYLTSLGERLLATRQAEFATEPEAAFDIHVEKLQRLAAELQELRVAHMDSYPWLKVERETALDFMAYLAASLGQLKELSALPITDEPEYLDQFTHRSSPGEGINSLRVRVLGDLLPTPAVPIDPAELALFKVRSGQELVRFRRRIELELIDTLSIEDEALREERLQLFLESANDEIEYVSELMAKNSWVRTNLIRLSAVVPSIPGVGAVTGLAFAAVGAFGQQSKPLGYSPFLYAAETRRLIT